MYRVGIIGAGIGAEHAAGYAALADRFAIHSICDLDEERGRPLADEYGAGFTTGLDSVLVDPDVDIVDICLPPHLHFNACMKALDAGKKVICEKPLVGSLAEADMLAAKLEETSGFLSPVFQYRYGTGAAQLHALVEAGLAGRFFTGSLETHWDRDSAYYGNGWRGTWAGEQGGAILTHAIHIHDLLTAFLGPVARVQAALATRVNDIEVEDCAALVITMESGAPVTSSVTLGAAGNTSRLRLMFEGFTVESDHAPYAPAAERWRFTARSPTTQAQIDSVLETVAPVKAGYAGMFEALAKYLAGEGGREVVFADGRRSLEFVTAVYHAARTAMPVALPLDSLHPLYRGWAP